MAEVEKKRRKPYRPPEVVEIVLDPQEAYLSPCTSNTVSTPPCSAPNHSVIVVK